MAVLWDNAVEPLIYKRRKKMVLRLYTIALPQACNLGE